MNIHLYFEHGRTDACLCPTCGEMLDAYTATEAGSKPAHGDVTVCLYCQTPLEYTKTLTVKKIDVATLPAEIAGVILRLQKMLRTFREEMPDDKPRPQKN